MSCLCCHCFIAALDKHNLCRVNARVHLLGFWHIKQANKQEVQQPVSECFPVSFFFFFSLCPWPLCAAVAKRLYPPDPYMESAPCYFACTTPLSSRQSAEGVSQNPDIQANILIIYTSHDVINALQSAEHAPDTHKQNDKDLWFRSYIQVLLRHLCSSFCAYPVLEWR